MAATQQLIPAPEMSPPSIAHLSPDERARLWAQMVDEGDRLLFEGFVRRCGDERSARRVMLEWLDRRDADSTAAKLRMLRGCGSAERFNGR
jgi:hypothetical protein